jgi:hypothetical protein
VVPIGDPLRGTAGRAALRGSASESRMFQPQRTQAGLEHTGAQVQQSVQQQSASLADTAGCAAPIRYRATRHLRVGAAI